MWRKTSGEIVLAVESMFRGIYLRQHPAVYSRGEQYDSFVRHELTVASSHRASHLMWLIFDRLAELPLRTRFSPIHPLGQSRPAGAAAKRFAERTSQRCTDQGVSFFDGFFKPIRG